MCGCGGPEAINNPESGDLIAVIHPVSLPLSSSPPSETDKPPLSRRSSSSSTTSSSSCTSFSSTRIFTGGRLTLSNRLPGMTSTTFNTSTTTDPETQTLNIRIHQFGIPLDVPSMPNPIMYAFESPSSQASAIMLEKRLDLSIGIGGVLGRTVSVCDAEGKIVGEGVFGRL